MPILRYECMETIVEIENNVKLDLLLTHNREMDKKLNDLTKKVIRKARGELVKNARVGLDMDSDPRSAYRAIKSTVYRRIKGGNVSILSKRRASSKRYPVPTSTRGRSQRTEQLMSYYGADRGFVLRFINKGTKQRTVKGFNGRRGFKSPDATGDRDRITGRNWFGHASQAEMERAAAELEKMIDELISNTKV